MDRNLNFLQCLVGRGWSLSARRAWIEMLGAVTSPAVIKVALRKESVDRNGCCVGALRVAAGVALRKESVDRNRDLQVIK